MHCPILTSRPAVLVTLLPVAVLALLAAGCDGSSSPTDPGGGTPPPAAGSATIHGEVTVGTSGLVSGGARGTSAHGPSGRTGRDPDSSFGGTTTASPSPATSGAGVVVRVQGTGLSTTADASGAFFLQGVPQGDQTLIFETSQSAAGLPIPAIQPGETIRLSVTVQGSTATTTDVDRDGGEGDEEDDEGEPELSLSLQVSPSTWNLSYEDSSGTVTAFIRGQGFRDVLLDSIVLVGDDEDAEPLAPVSASREGNHVRSRFSKSEVLGLLAEPADGSVHTVALLFEVDGVDELQELTAQIRVVGDDEEDDGEDEELGNLSLQLSPSTWNTNWDRANGHVTAFIRGDGLAAIDVDSIELEGDDPEADPLPASSARLEGNHVRAQFPKNQVLDLLDEPEPGQTRTVTVRFTSDGGAETHELQEDVRIVGPPV